MADEHISVPDCIRANAATHWARKPVFYFSSIFFIYLTLLDLINRCIWRWPGPLLDPLIQFPMKSAPPKWVFVGFFLFFLHATSFLHSALLPSGTHCNHQDVLCFFILSQTSDLGVNAARGSALRSSGHLDHRRSTGERHWATHSALTASSAAVRRLSWVSCKV